MAVVDTDKINEWKTSFEAEYTNYKNGKEKFNEGSMINTFYNPLTKMAGILKPLYDNMTTTYEDILNHMSGVSVGYANLDNSAGGVSRGLNTGLTPGDTVSSAPDTPTIIPIDPSDITDNPDIIGNPNENGDGTDTSLREETLDAPDTTFLEFFKEFCPDEYYGTGTVIGYMSRFLDLSASMYGTLNATASNGSARQSFLDYFDYCTENKVVNSAGDPYNAVNSLDEYLKNYKTLKNGSQFGVDKMTFEKYYNEFIKQNPDKNSFENVFSAYFEYIKD